MKRYSFITESGEVKKPLDLSGLKAGDFTAKAKSHGKSPIDFAKEVMADTTGKYDGHTRKQASFVIVSSRWHHGKKK